MTTEVSQWDEDFFVNLSALEIKFVKAYVETDDKAEAGQLTIPGTERPVRLANSMLAKPGVRAAIARCRAAVLDSIAMTKADILREIQMLAQFNPKDYLDEDGNPMRLADLPDWKARALGEVEYAVDPQGRVILGMAKTKKLDALKVLAKATGLLDKGSDADRPVYNIDLSLSPDRGAVVTAGGVTLDIRTTGG